VPNLPTVTLAGNLAAIFPPELVQLKRWTAWQLVAPTQAGKKPAKKPLSLVNDAATWKTMADAISAAGGRAGVGFQMLGITSYVGLDLDGCVDPVTGATSKLAASLLAALPDTYAEITPSGKGLRVFCKRPDGMSVPEFLSAAHGVECYVGKSARFLTVTGKVIPGRERKLSDLTDAALRILAPFASNGGAQIDVEVKLEVPDFPRTEDWPRIFDAKRGKLGKELFNYMQFGDVPGARSEKSYAVACKMLAAHYSPDEVFIALISAPGAWEAALDKRDQDTTRARALIWADIGRAQKVVRAEAGAVEGKSDEWNDLGLHTEIANKTIRVVTSPANASRILTMHSKWRNRVQLDITTGLVMLDSTTLDDGRFFILQEEISRFAGWAPGLGRQWWSDVLRSVAEKSPINPRAAWLRSIKWDSKPRLDAWMNDHLAAAPDSLNAIIGRKWLISLVARWLDPGCKVDTVLILIGKEGTKKTTFYEIMAGGPERVVDLEGFSRDDKFVMARAWLVEMPEAHILKRGDQNKIKAFITKPTDDYRVPYAPAPVTIKRGFIFVSTANGGEVFQAGQDGLRRFWPVDVRDERIDLAWMRENREQLLAEAVVAYDVGEEWWFETTPPELAARQQDAVEDTAIDGAIELLVARQMGKGGLSLSEVMAELGQTLGFRPNERLVSLLLPRHGVVKRRTPTHRFWLHPKWDAPTTNVIPLKSSQQA